MSENGQNNLSASIGAIVAVFLAVLGWAITWGSVQTKVEAAEIRLNRVENTVERQADKVNSIDKNVVEIKSDIRYIREAVKQDSDK